MIKNKAALITSVVILIICMSLFFPFPNNVMLLETRTTFMSFPIRNQEGFIWLGVIGSILFIIAMVLLMKSITKYHIRTFIIAVIIYMFLPQLLITMYQETLASGIYAISYDNNGTCYFNAEGEDLLTGECNFLLHNRSNQDVTFELEFLDSSFMEEGEMNSLMNLAGPYIITIEANRKKSINLIELLNVKDVPNHIEGGAANNIHFKLIDGNAERIL